jgi:AbrB family looped-hinge helix DNA binding protein
MAYTSTVSEKGQVTLPKALRDALGIRTGERIEFTLERDGIKVKKRPDLDGLAALYGSLKLPAPVDQLIDEMRGGPADP